MMHCRLVSHCIYEYLFKFLVLAVEKVVKLKKRREGNVTRGGGKGKQ